MNSYCRFSYDSQLCLTGTGKIILLIQRQWRNLDESVWNWGTMCNYYKKGIIELNYRTYIIYTFIYIYLYINKYLQLRLCSPNRLSTYFTGSYNDKPGTIILLIPAFLHSFSAVYQFHSAAHFNEIAPSIAAENVGRHRNGSNLCHSILLEVEAMLVSTS